MRIYPGPPDEPFVYCNDWPVILLYLFFTKCHIRNKRHFKRLFYHLVNIDPCPGGIAGEPASSRKLVTQGTKCKHQGSYGCDFSIFSLHCKKLARGKYFIPFPLWRATILKS